MLFGACVRVRVVEDEAQILNFLRLSGDVCLRAGERRQRTQWLVLFFRCNKKDKKKKGKNELLAECRRGGEMRRNNKERK